MGFGIKFPKKEVIIQFSSLAQPCPTLWEPMDCSTPGLLVHYQLLGFTQTHVHWVVDAIQPSHPLSSPSPPAFKLSQHQGLFKRVPRTARRSNQSILKEISPEYSLEGLMMKLKLQYFGHLMQRTDSFEKTFEVIIKISWKVDVLCYVTSVMSNSFWPHGL